MKHISFTFFGLFLSFFSFAISPITGSFTVCAGASTPLSDATSGGTWSSSTLSIATIGSTSALLTGVSAGIATITYTVGGSYVTQTVTVNATPTSIIGSTIVCGIGDSTTLSDASTGGEWSCVPTSVAAIGSTGVVIGGGIGTAIVSYYFPSTYCAATLMVSVDAAPASITGVGTICSGTVTTLSDATTGGTWSSSSTSIATVGSGTGIVMGIAGGSATISYILPSTCSVTKVVTINPSPTITASAVSSCGGTYTLTAAGGTSYIWSPSTDLSCTTCSTTYSDPMTTIAYTVSGTNGFGCSGSAVDSVDGDRISGYIPYGGSGSIKVWLVQFNPSDSIITAVDSTIACSAGGTPYYEFDNKPSGNYMVKAYLLGGIPGSSGYIPTYGLSTAHWDTATTISHTSGTDTLTINMIYGSVPSGPGFISGSVLSGAGRNTSGDIPAPGMLIYLEDAMTSNILTYTYTNSSGVYSFGGLANGSYIIYPETYKYYTTPSSIVILSPTTDTASNIDFKQHTTFGTITPYTVTLSNQTVTSVQNITVFPNPAKDELNVDGILDNTSYRLLSVTGICYSTGIFQQTSNTLSMANCAAGIYILETNTPTGQKNIYRIVKE